MVVVRCSRNHHTKMEKEEGVVVVVEDIEEGQISDDEDSIKEISADDFKQQEVGVGGGAAVGVGAAAAKHRVWTTRDLYNYSVSSNYGSGFHNLAWAQAVQNKPLNEVLDFGNNNIINNDDDDNNVLISDDDDVVCGGRQEIVNVDDGELEEGEIGLDSGEPNANDSHLNDKNNENPRVKLIRQDLDSLIQNSPQPPQSFDALCSKLQICLDRLKSVILDNCASTQVEALIQHSLVGVTALNSVLCSKDSIEKQQFKGVFLRLLSHVKSQEPVLFSTDQMKEIDTLIASLESECASPSDMEVDPDNLDSGETLGLTSSASLKTALLETTPVDCSNQLTGNVASENLKHGFLSVPRGRGSFGPLLDLHRDHDIDSLPSPTRETPMPFKLSADVPLPVQETIHPVKVVKENDHDVNNLSSSKSGTHSPFELWKHNTLPSPTREIPARESPMPFEVWKNKDYDIDSLPSPTRDTPTTARESPMPFELWKNKNHDIDSLPSPTRETPSQFKFQKHNDYVYSLPFLNSQPSPTVATKFSPNSFFLSNELPSPTPSEECDDGEGNATEEVSSIPSNVVTLTPPALAPPVVPAIPSTQMDSSVVVGAMHAKTIAQVTSGLNPPVRASSLKSRDPRLRFGNAEIPKSEFNGAINGSRKHKNEADTVVDTHKSKRQRNEIPTTSGSLADIAIATPTSTGSTQPADGNEKLELIRPIPASLPELLKDIAGNPSMLIQILMEQQKLAVEAPNQSSHVAESTPAFNSSVIAGTVPFVNAALSKTSVTEQAAARSQYPAQTTSMSSESEREKIRMKPRDPRRILHSSSIKKNESIGLEQAKTNGAPSLVAQTSKDDLNVRHQGEHALTTSPQSAPPPDIARQFTNKLKNLADIMSSSQAANSVSLIPHVGSSQPIKMDTGNLDYKDQQCATGLTPDGVVGPPQPQQSWGDVEHLFERYDDQQKAAIQRERSRRIDEQNKMFAARKLCLVLDLDHTLLNSAKFIEVDPMHDEILRKKEEQDREKPQRHLFRFPHMGMWTKLRPGIWNFLEKASRLYELHLYTMGNKLYATEMAKVLDPTGVLFAGRVISRGDDGDPFDSDEKLQPKSKDLEGVLGMESSVVIIDDSVKVWPHNKLNLILVERYTYFPCSRHQFGLPGPSLLEIDHDERPEDGTLASSLGVIERIHHSFFSHPSFHEVDVRNILALEQQRILAGCCILFSRIFPVGQANPQQHPLWQTAQQFGAVCTNQIGDRVTHVVASSLGTDKVNWALSTGRFVVHPGWVEASALLYRRANELDFVVKQNLP